MTVSSTHEVTQLLKAWTTGDEQALEKLTPLVYQQLHRAAQRYMAGERSGHVLQTTALVNEVYLRLVDCDQINWQDRAHFFAVSAQLMRRILVDFARSRGYQKRGGGAPHISLDEAPSVCNEPDANLVAMDDALKALATVDAQEKQGCGTEILWRIEHGRNRRSIEGFGGNRGAGLEVSKGLAPAGVEPGESTWSLNSGVESKICITAPWSGTRAAALNS